MIHKANKKLMRLTHIFETILVVLVGIAAIISMFDLVKYFPRLFSASYNNAYLVLQEFLGHVLQTVIAVELMLMLLNRTVVSILYLVLFVIARKMLIYAVTMTDLVLGTIALLLVAIILKYFVEGFDIGMGYGEMEVKSDVPLKYLEDYLGIEVDPEETRTIGELVDQISGDRTIENMEFYFGNMSVEVVEVEDGKASLMTIRNRKMV